MFIIRDNSNAFASKGLGSYMHAARSLWRNSPNRSREPALQSLKDFMWKTPVRPKAGRVVQRLLP